MAYTSGLKHRRGANPILAEMRRAESQTGAQWARERFYDALTTDERAPEMIRAVVRRASPAAARHARRLLGLLRTLS